MTNQTPQEEIINNLKEIKKTTENCLDAFYSDQLLEKQAEDSMNYVRLCTQRVQYFFKILNESC